MELARILKSLAIRKGILQKDIAPKYNMSANNFNNKIQKCETRFNVKDLIKYATICGLRIAFVDEENRIIEIVESGKEE